MPTADAACQTHVVHISSLRWEDTQDALNKIMDQGIRSNMRLQDVRSRLKDVQDDIRVLKRCLNIEDAQGKRMKFAVDPTEGPAKDYLKDEMDKKAKKLGSSSPQSCLLEHKSDLGGGVKKLRLWKSSESDEEKKEPEVEKPPTSKADPLATLRAPAESSYEEENTDPDEPQLGTVTWIVFEGENEQPVRMDKLSPAQEMMLENGKPYRFYDIVDHHYAFDDPRSSFGFSPKLLFEATAKSEPFTGPHRAIPG